MLRSKASWPIDVVVITVLSFFCHLWLFLLYQKMSESLGRLSHGGQWEHHWRPWVVTEDDPSCGLISGSRRPTLNLLDPHWHPHSHRYPHQCQHLHPHPYLSALASVSTSVFVSASAASSPDAPRLVCKNRRPTPHNPPDPSHLQQWRRPAWSSDPSTLPPPPFPPSAGRGATGPSDAPGPRLPKGTDACPVPLARVTPRCLLLPQRSNGGLACSIVAGA